MQFALIDHMATQAFGQALGQQLPAGMIVLLTGELGSGKTSLVQAMGIGLGIDAPIVSPTFTLINEYHEGRVPLYHLDLYRLQGPEIADLDLERYWQGVEVPLGIVAIEWPDRLVDLPEAYLSVQLTYAAQGRQVEVQPMGTLETLDLEHLRTSLQR